MEVKIMSSFIVSTYNIKYKKKSFYSYRAFDTPRLYKSAESSGADGKTSRMHFLKYDKSIRNIAS